MNRETIIDIRKIENMENIVNAVNKEFLKINNRLDAHYERMNVISNNLSKTHKVVCSNGEKLDGLKMKNDSLLTKEDFNDFKKEIITLLK